MASADGLLDHLAQYRDVLVAFSGGADSALVLAASVRALSAGRVTAATAVSPSLGADELAAARGFARELGVRHLLPETHEGGRAGYVANGRDRCYFCKSELLDVMTLLAGTATVLTGTNADDLRDPHRPGIRAAAERGARTPLADVGLTKADVRAISREWRLVTWDKPAAPCLASRVAYGIAVTPHRLARVERAETAVRTWLREHGVVSRDLRVRDLGDVARVEVDAAVVARVDVSDVLLAEGFTSVSVGAFRSGALNDMLTA